MNAPLLLSILIALVCAELAFSHRSKSLSEEKAGEMSDKIKAALQEDADARSFLYRLKYPTRNKWGCYEADGASYRGRKATTNSGRICQDWAKHSPHKHHHLTPKKYPDSDLTSNYCRNPDGEPEPWCYTTDDEKRWEFCGIPKCSDIDDCAPNPCKHGACQDKLNDFTCACDAGWKGKTCEQNIDDCAKDPCKHGTCQDGFKDFACTCDPGWEGKLCDKDIDYCAKDPCEHGTCQDGLNDFTCTCVSGWEGKLCDKGCYEADGASYRGKKATTNSGRICQDWAKQSPHKHKRTPKNYPDSDLTSNYCRNPDGEPNGPWCYTTDENKRWEYCGIPKCSV